MGHIDSFFASTIILSQSSPGFEFRVFNPQSLDPTILLQIMLGIAFLIGSLIYGVHRYKTWKNFKIFEEELRSLEMSSETQNTFVEMVKRYQFEEPVNVIYSQRLFDEMAAKEIVNILASAGSKKTKEHFINMIEEIRIQTYNPDWTKTKSQIKNAVQPEQTPELA